MLLKLKFLPDHSFERMAARLCAMEATPPPPADAETAYAATEDHRLFLINTHVDDGGAILTWRSKYDETLRALSNRYPGTLDSSSIDRYLGMGFSYNSETGAMTASMYHSVLKVLATFCTSSLPEQITPYTMDLFDISDDPTPADSVTYLATHLATQAPLRDPARHHHDLYPQLLSYSR